MIKLIAIILNHHNGIETEQYAICPMNKVNGIIRGLKSRKNVKAYGGYLIRDQINPDKRSDLFFIKS
jgi:hypothetical protein